MLLEWPEIEAPAAISLSEVWESSAQRHIPPNCTVGVSGTLTVTFIDNGPVVVEVDGCGSVHGLQVATAKLLFQTNGYSEVDGNVDVDLGVAELKASLKAFADLPAKGFSAQINESLNIGGYPAIGAQGIISEGVCARLLPRGGPRALLHVGPDPQRRLRV